MNLVDKAQQHISEILDHAILHQGDALVIYDTDAPLTNILTEAYRKAMPTARFIDFATVTQESILEEFAKLEAGHLVVMIQSGNFRLNEFRIRIFLFAQGLKVIEHMHLYRMPEDQWETYINALHYDPAFYHALGHGVREKLRHATRAEVRCRDTVLIYDTPFEAAKLNIGDYREMNNVGGTFPIGEVFTEATHLDRVNGEVRIYAFAGLDHLARIYEPFRVTIENGILHPTDECPQDFLDILQLIAEDEPVHVREFGLGMNPALSKEHLLSDVTSFERVTGLHLSLGGKHAIYKKPEFRKAPARYHIDVFVDATEILLDGEILYKDGKYLV